MNANIHQLEQALHTKLKEGFSHEVSWYTCNQEGSITGLHLFNLDSNAQRINTDLISLLDQLTELSFSNCKVNLSYFLPVAHHLKSLSFEDSEIEQRGALAHFEQLEYLSAHAWTDDEIKLIDLKELLPLKHKLKKIDVFDGYVSNMELLKEFTALEELDTTISSIELVEHVLGFKSLKKLDLSIVDIDPKLATPIVLDLKALQKVETLTLRTDDGISFKGVEHLESLQKLELSFDCNLEGLGALKELAFLEIPPDINVNEVPGIASLKTLILFMDGSYALHSLEQFPNLEKLDLIAPDGKVISLGVLKKLKVLKLEQIGQKETSCFHNLKNLEVLSLDIAGAGRVENLCHLTRLRYLDLRYNELESIEGLENLKNLEYLNLAGNKISDIQVLNQLPKLIMVNLEENNISEEDVEQQLQRPAVAAWLGWQGQWSFTLSRSAGVEYAGYSLSDFMFP